MRQRDKALDEFLQQRSQKITEFHFLIPAEKKIKLIKFMKDCDLRPFNQGIDD